MSDPNHPIFKQFSELDPSRVVIRDTPHPDWVWSQPPIPGTLTPGDAHRIPGQPYMPGSNNTWVPPTGGPQVSSQPQQWQPDFPGLWDDVPGSGTGSMPNARPYPSPQYSTNATLAMGHSEGLAGSAGRLPESQPKYGHQPRAADRPRVDQSH